jgi:hypothetical protein
MNLTFISLYYSHSVNASVQTKFEVQLAEVACQSIKHKDRDVGVILFQIQEAFLSIRFKLISMKSLSTMMYRLMLAAIINFSDALDHLFYIISMKTYNVLMFFVCQKYL